MTKQKSSARLRFTGVLTALALFLFLVPALQAGDYRLYMLAVGAPCAVLLCCTLIARAFSLDRLILAVSLFFCAAGIAVLAPADPDAALVQSVHCGVGIVALIVGAVFIRSLSGSLLAAGSAAFLGLLLLAARLLAPEFTVPVTQPALVLLLIAFAALLSREGPVSAALLGIASAALLLVRGDLPDALIWSVTVLLLLFAADGRLMVLLPSLGAFALVFYGAYLILGPLPAPQPGLSPDTLAAIGALGTDALPESLYAAGSAALFPGLTGRYGLIFSGLAVLLFLPLLLRGTAIASCARMRFHAVLAMGICLLFGLYALSSVLAFFGFLPFPGPDMPLLTASLPALCAQLFAAGLLCGISGRNDSDLAEDAHLAMLAK